MKSKKFGLNVQIITQIRANQKIRFYNKEIHAKIILDHIKAGSMQYRFVVKKPLM